MGDSSQIKIEKALSELVATDTEIDALNQEKDVLDRGYREQKEVQAFARAVLAHRRKCALIVLHGKKGYREEYLEWAKEKLGVKQPTADYYADIGSTMLRHCKSPMVQRLSFAALRAFVRLGLNPHDEERLVAWIQRQDEPPTASRVKGWWERDKPTSEGKLNGTDSATAPTNGNPLNTMEGRLADPNLTGSALLGLGIGAKRDVIKIVTKHLQQQFHPDKGGDHATFTRIQKAIEVVRK